VQVQEVPLPPTPPAPPAPPAPLRQVLCGFSSQSEEEAPPEDTPLRLLLLLDLRRRLDDTQTYTTQHTNARTRHKEECTLSNATRQRNFKSFITHMQKKQNNYQNISNSGYLRPLHGDIMGMLLTGSAVLRVISLLLNKLASFILQTDKSKRKSILFS
jgi:hypothetical protein